MPKKLAGTVDTIKENDATATSNSTRMILLRMVSSCIAHTSRVLSMFSTISCNARSLFCCPVETSFLDLQQESLSIPCCSVGILNDANQQISGRCSGVHLHVLV